MDNEKKAKKIDITWQCIITLFTISFWSLPFLHRLYSQNQKISYDFMTHPIEHLARQTTKQYFSLILTQLPACVVLVISGRVRLLCQLQFQTKLLSNNIHFCVTIFQINMSSIQQQRMVVEQLRREASIKRISVSQAVEDIKVSQDFLLYQVHKNSLNYLYSLYTPYKK